MTIERRPDNVNGATSKQRSAFEVEAPPALFQFYRDYLLGELAPAGIESDYLFVNLHREPVGHPDVLQQRP